MLSFIWSVMVLFSIGFAFFSGNGDKFVDYTNLAIINGKNIFFIIAPLMCFWSGIMEIADRSNVTKMTAKILSPMTNFLFSDIKNDKETMKRISMNMSANLLGMGNAATPLGLRAMERLNLINNSQAKASNAMCMFVIVNTASIQLVPTSVISLRAGFGSASPSDILPAVMITTLSAFLVGTLSAKLCSLKR